MTNQSTLGGDTISPQQIKKKKEHAEKSRSNPACEECGQPKEFVDEPMISGFRGYLCMNDDCVRDS